MTPILLDTIIAIVILLSVIVAFFRGFIKEMLTIVNLAGAAAAAYFMGPILLPSFKNWLGAGEKGKEIFGVIPPSVMANFLSYAAVFFCVFIILSLAGMAIASGAKAMGLGPADRVLGMIFGALRGFLIVFLIYAPFGYFMGKDKLPEWAKDSLSVSALDSSYQWTQDYLKGVKHETSEDDTPLEPGSVRAKLRKMAEDALPKENSDSGSQKEILPDEEKAMPR